MTDDQLAKIYYENQATVNQMHQADLLYLPDDNQSTYKYALNVIDVASCLKASRPLKTRKASKVADALQDIYKGPLRCQKEFRVDGVRFKAGDSVMQIKLLPWNNVLKLMKEKWVKVVYNK